MTSYRHFAYIYDSLMDHAPYEKWTKFTEQMIKHENTQIETIVDLGCGTGEITIRLAQLGYNMTGVDFSADMLARASEKAIDRKVSVNWLQQDIRNLDGLTNIDLFTSYCDVINYITELSDIESVFTHVYNGLAPDGVFIFDIHNLHYIENHLINHTFSDVTDELAYIWNCEQGDTKGEMYHYLTLFQKEMDKYLRFDEIHHQHTYDINTYKHLLKNCGFSKIQVYSDFLMEKDFSLENSERIFIIAKK